MSLKLDDEMLVCRCEEVSVKQIKEAIAQGAIDVVGVKRRTRAGMGLCQGRTCERMVQQILAQELGIGMDETGNTSTRPPVRPITIGALAGGVVDE